MVDTFNARQWAEDHETVDNLRHQRTDKDIANIWKVLACAGVSLIGVLGWSLQAQYDSIALQRENNAATLQAIQEIKVAVSNSAVSR